MKHTSSTTKLQEMEQGEEKQRKQIEAVLDFCRGPNDEKRFAGLMLLTKIEGAREYLVSAKGSSLALEFFTALTTPSNFLGRLLKSDQEWAADTSARGLALSILSLFLEHESVLLSSAFLQISPTFLQIFTATHSFDSEVSNFLWKLLSQYESKRSRQNYMRLSAFFSRFSRSCFVSLLENIRTQPTVIPSSQELVEKKLRLLALILSLMSQEPADIKESAEPKESLFDEDEDSGVVEDDEEDHEELDAYKKKGKRKESDDEEMYGQDEEESEKEKEGDKQEKDVYQHDEDKEYGLSPFLSIPITTSLFAPTLDFLLSNLTQYTATESTSETKPSELVKLDLLHTLLLLLRAIPIKMLDQTLATRTNVGADLLHKLRKILWKLLTTKLPFKSLYITLAISNHVISTIGWEWTVLLDSEISEFGVVLSPFPSSTSPESPKTKLFETLMQRSAIEIDLGLRDVVNRKEIEEGIKPTARAAEGAAAETKSTTTAVDTATSEDKVGVLLLSFSLLQSSMDFALSQLDEEEEQDKPKKSAEKFPTSVLVKVYELIKNYSEQSIQYITILRKRAIKSPATSNLDEVIAPDYDVPVLFSAISLVTAFISESMNAATVKKMAELLPFLANITDLHLDLVPAFLELVLCLLKSDDTLTKDLLSIEITKRRSKEGRAMEVEEDQGKQKEVKKEGFVNWLLELSKATTTTPTITQAAFTANTRITGVVTTIATILSIIVHKDNKDLLRNSQLVLLVSGLCLDLVELVRNKFDKLRGTPTGNIERMSIEAEADQDEINKDIEAIGYISYILLKTIASPFPTSEFIKDSENIVLHITEGLELMFKYCVRSFDEIQEDSLVLWVLETCTEICIENPKFRDLWRVWAGRTLPTNSQNPTVKNFLRCL